MFKSSLNVETLAIKPIVSFWGDRTVQSFPILNKIQAFACTDSGQLVISLSPALQGHPVKIQETISYFEMMFSFGPQRDFMTIPKGLSTRNLFRHLVG